MFFSPVRLSPLFSRHGIIARDLMDQKAKGDEEEGGGVGGGSDPREDSVLLALPGFRFTVSYAGVRQRERSVHGI